MAHSYRSMLISSIIKKKLYEEVEQILSISRQGFDVYAKVDFPEVKISLVELLEQEIKINSKEFRVIDKVEMLDLNEYDVKENGILPTVLVGDFNLGVGFGFVNFSVRKPDALLGHVATSVDIILKHFGLEFYIDVFDSQKLARLKQLARTRGLLALIDAVIQTAYLGGFCGDIIAAQEFLDKAQYVKDAINYGETISLENCAKKFLSYVISFGDDAHCFLKSCLSYYVTSMQGYTMTRASQMLSISRTTLQEHLKLAQHLGVSSFFEGTDSRMHSENLPKNDITK